MSIKNVAFIGVGKLGKEVSEVMATNYNVIGYDINPEALAGVNIQGKTIDLPIAVTGADIVFIAVPTQHHPDYDGRAPSSHLEPKDFDYSIVESVVTEVNKYIKEGTIVVLISTVLPGTVRRLVADKITRGRFVYNPYLIAQGTVRYDMINPEMIMIGTEDGSTTDTAAELIEFYKPLVNPVSRYHVGTWEEVESMKVFYNTFITTKLVLVNMIQDVAMTVGHMNVDVVTDALKKSTDRIMGPKYMKAGLGDGGGCHPRDNIALRWLAQETLMGYDLLMQL